MSLKLTLRPLVGGLCIVNLACVIRVMCSFSRKGLQISLGRSMQNAGDVCVKRWALTGVWQMPSFFCNKCYCMGEEFYCWRTCHVRKNENSILCSSLPLSFFGNTGDLNLGSCAIELYHWAISSAQHLYTCMGPCMHLCTCAYVWKTRVIAHVWRLEVNTRYLSLSLSTLYLLGQRVLP